MHTPPRRSAESGIILVSVLLIAALVTALTTVGAMRAQSELRIARKSGLAARALAVAEAGLDHAIAEIEADTADGFDDELSNAGTGGSLVSIGGVVAINGDDHRFRNFGNAPTDGYYVRVLDNFDETTGADDPAVDTDNTVRVISRGRIDSAERVIEAIVRIKEGPDCAVTVADNLRFRHNTILDGERGCAQSCGSMALNDAGFYEAGAYATGTMTISGTPVMEGQVLSTPTQKADYAAEHSGIPCAPLPRVDPLKFGPSQLNLALEVNAAGGYRLTEYCMVYQGGTWTCSPASPWCGGGTLVADLSGGGSYMGWSCTTDGAIVPPAKWTYATNAVNNGLFYVEGWVDITGAPVGWKTTIVALNSIQVRAALQMEPALTTGNLRNLLLVSGNDVEVRSDAVLGSLTTPGAIFAHQQVGFENDSMLFGFALAEDATNTWADDPAPFATTEKNIESYPHDLEHNVHITYDGLDIAGLWRVLEVAAWHEVRD